MLLIQVLDHVVIGHNSYFSFADEGLIKGFVLEFEQRFQSLHKP
jgi:DNA repair protein RadC